jgi:hypothetical protein
MVGRWLVAGREVDEVGRWAAESGTQEKGVGRWTIAWRWANVAGIWAGESK